MPRCPTVPGPVPFQGHQEVRVGTGADGDVGPGALCQIKLS